MDGMVPHSVQGQRVLSQAPRSFLNGNQHSGTGVRSRVNYIPIDTSRDGPLTQLSAEQQPPSNSFLEGGPYSASFSFVTQAVDTV